MTIYYVSPERGSDSNPGTKQHPFKTAKRGLDLRVVVRGK